MIAASAMEDFAAASPLTMAACSRLTAHGCSPAVELPDSIVSALIFGLSHREEEGRARYINYRDFSVQQLGTIYERTLEYGLT